MGLAEGSQGPSLHSRWGLGAEQAGGLRSWADGADGGAWGLQGCVWLVI